MSSDGLYSKRLHPYTSTSISKSSHNLLGFVCSRYTTTITKPGFLFETRFMTCFRVWLQLAPTKGILDDDHMLYKGLLAASALNAQSGPPHVYPNVWLSSWLIQFDGL